MKRPAARLGVSERTTYVRTVVKVRIYVQTRFVVICLLQEDATVVVVIPI